MNALADEPQTATTSATTRGVVESFFAAVGQGDRQGALDLVADSVEWGGAGDRSIPWIGDRHGRAEAGEFLNLLAENLSTETFDIIATIVEGQNAAVIVSLKQIVVKTGRAFEGEMVFHLRVENARIVRYRYYEDSLALARAYGLI